MARLFTLFGKRLRTKLLDANGSVKYTVADIKAFTTKTLKLSAGNYTLNAENTEPFGKPNTAKISLKGN